ncbi:Necrosis inducing protein [Phytophthora cactorum]|nr:Necrosis inducing protein [Phytophthora cactorum]
MPDAKILACSVSSHSGDKKFNPCPPWVIDGASLKVRYMFGWSSNRDLYTSGEAGTIQDLVTWDQMTNDGRRTRDSVVLARRSTIATSREGLAFLFLKPT